MHPNIAILAEFLSISVEDTAVVNDTTFDVRSEATAAQIGIGYQRGSSRWNRIDWLASLLFQRAEFENSVANVGSITTETDSLGVELGLRASITPRFEVQGLISSFFSDGDFGDERLELTSVYRVLNNFDVALGVFDATDSPTFNIGLRYSWQ